MEATNIAAGSLGPRLAGRLTAELILRSPQYMNCVGNYEIDLRDNAVVLLEGFPKLPRLHVLLLNSNRVTRIGRDLQESIPNLEFLVLTNNKVMQLQALDPLATLPKLSHLSLIGNPVTKVKNYRLYLIHLLPKLKVLDFRKVKQQEQAQAAAAFGKEIADGSAKTFEPGEDLEMAEASIVQAEETDVAKPSAPTPEQLTAIKAAIANAQTLEEVQRLESALKQGKMPSEMLDPGKLEENGESKDAAIPNTDDKMDED